MEKHQWMGVFLWMCMQHAVPTQLDLDLFFASDEQL